MKQIFTLTTLLCILCAQAQLNNGLIGKYYFNSGTSDDDLGNFNLQGQGTNAVPVLTADRFGNANKAYEFDGSNYLFPGANSQVAYNLDVRDELSISVWVKPTTVNVNQSSNGHTIIGKWDQNANRDQFLLEINNAKTLTAIRAVNDNGVVDTFEYAANNWYHIVFTYSKTDNNRHKVYVNGALKLNQTFSGTYSNSNPPAAFLIGMRASSSNGFIGTIDDIRIYDRVISPTEVNCLYNEPDPTSNPVTLGVTLTSSPTNVCAGNQVTLTANTSGPVVNYNWSSGASSSNNSTAIATPTTNTTYAVTVSDALGCNTATASISINVNSLPNPTITQNGNTLSTQTFNSYQWQLNGNDINGATNQSYTATQSGSYAVRVTDASGCTNTSSAVNITISSVSEMVDFRSVIYPNPTTSVLNIESDEEIQSIQVVDITGRVVITQSKIQNLKTKIDVSGLAEATYFIHIKTFSGKKAIKSFVKQ